MPDRVADAESCEPERLGEGPQRHDVGPAQEPEHAHPVDGVGLGDEFGVRLVEDDHDVRGDRIKERGELVVRHDRSEEHTSELQSLMRISYAVFCLKKKKKNTKTQR